MAEENHKSESSERRTISDHIQTLQRAGGRSGQEAQSQEQQGAQSRGDHGREAQSSVQKGAQSDGKSEGEGGASDRQSGDQKDGIERTSSPFDALDGITVKNADATTADDAKEQEEQDSDANDDNSIGRREDDRQETNHPKVWRQRIEDAKRKQAAAYDAKIADLERELTTAKKATGSADRIAELESVIAEKEAALARAEEDMAKAAWPRSADYKRRFGEPKQKLAASLDRIATGNKRAQEVVAAIKSGRIRTVAEIPDDLSGRLGAAIVDRADQFFAIADDEAQALRDWETTSQQAANYETENANKAMRTVAKNMEEGITRSMTQSVELAKQAFPGYSESHIKETLSWLAGGNPQQTVANLVQAGVAVPWLKTAVTQRDAAIAERDARIAELEKALGQANRGTRLDSLGGSFGSRSGQGPASNGSGDLRSIRDHVADVAKRTVRR